MHPTRTDARRRARALLLPCLAAVPFVVHAQAQPSVPLQTAAPAVIYPARGQSERQQDQDRYECHAWARGQSGGYDPTQPPALPTPPANTATTAPATAPSTSTPGGGAAGGMAAGAMGGAAVAELTRHDPGHAAAAGALGGALIQRVRQSQATQQQAARQQAAQQASMQPPGAAREQQRSTYERALGACMEGRGYTVR